MGDSLYQNSATPSLEMPGWGPWIKSVDAAVQRAIAPDAALLDRDPVALRQAFRWLGNQGWLHLAGGLGGAPVTPLAAGQFREVLARYSGALAFLQVQHQSAGAMVASSTNEKLRAEILPGLATGDRRLGIGFSHLRRQTPPVTATAVPGGYALTGTMPWVTGFGCFDAFVGAAVLEDGRSVFGLIPFGGDQKDGDRPLKISEPMALAAFSATQTVTVEFENWFLPEDQVLHRRSPDWIQINDRKKVLSSSFFALGCAQGSLDTLMDCLTWRRDVGLEDSIGMIAAELTACRDVVYGHYRNDRPNETESLSYKEQLRWRGRAIALALSAAQTALITSGGAANQQDHPAQRRSREAIVFGVTGQTSDVLRATLKAQRIPALARVSAEGRKSSD
ncbi:MAG: acyl-CoA dehydrogenase family protein [Cyanobacteria bacterium P01_H01_bin.130]